MIAICWATKDKALKTSTANESLMYIPVNFVRLWNPCIGTGIRVTDVNTCTNTAQNRCYEFEIPILSILDIMLNKNADSIVYM